MAATPLSEEQEREAFEAWAAKASTASLKRHESDPDEYACLFPNWTWHAWKAARALSAGLPKETASEPPSDADLDKLACQTGVCYPGRVSMLQCRNFARAAIALAAPPASPTGAAKQVLTEHEQRHVLADLQGLECLITYHDWQETMADAIEPGMCEGNKKRRLELLAIGRAIIAADPEIWSVEQRKPFDLRHSELAAGTEKPTTGAPK